MMACYIENFIIFGEMLLNNLQFSFQMGSQVAERGDQNLCHAAILLLSLTFGAWLTYVEQTRGTGRHH